MVKPVSLSDAAFAALRKEKRKGESDSDVVLRLVQHKHDHEKDPMHFVRTIPDTEMSWTAEQHKGWVDEMRGASARDAWDEASDRRRAGEAKGKGGSR